MAKQHKRFEALKALTLNVFCWREKQFIACFWKMLSCLLIGSSSALFGEGAPQLATFEILVPRPETKPSLL